MDDLTQLENSLRGAKAESSALHDRQRWDEIAEKLLSEFRKTSYAGRYPIDHADFMRWVRLMASEPVSFKVALEEPDRTVREITVMVKKPHLTTK